jgi:cytochrome o ubiquinol oxidase subunit 2
VLNPKGIIASRERNLIIVTVLLSLLVVLPVYVMTIMIAWKYRATNKHAKYMPDWDHHLGAEVAWWSIPSAIILVLSIITWNSSHSLDPYRPIDAMGVAPVDIQVVALDWKWLFIYPQQHVASVNLLEMPVNRPVNFEITADAPMNSLWIPQLGGQIYAMPGMVTQLHLMATQAGDYHGSSANISGAGFAGMTFVARAASQSNYESWLTAAKDSKASLNLNTYSMLAKPSQNSPVSYYALASNDLFDDVVDKFMVPNSPLSNTKNTNMAMPSMAGEMQ